MSHADANVPADPRLGQLIDLERDLARRVKDAEAEARSQLEAARAALSRERITRESALEAQAREQEREDRARHQEQLAEISAESRGRVSRLEQVSDARVEELARQAIEALLRELRRGGPR